MLQDLEYQIYRTSVAQTKEDVIGGALTHCLLSSGVWKGLIARIIMIGTLTALQWFIYDSVKVYFRLPRPPPPEMPESLKKKLGLLE